MSYQAPNPLTDEFELALDGPWTAYWLAFLRLVTGWWFFHAGVTKLIEDGLAYTYGPAYLQEMTGTALGPIPVWMGNNLAWLIAPGVPLFVTIIVVGAGRYYGLDGIIEQLEFVQQRPRLRYLLG